MVGGGGVEMVVDVGALSTSGVELV